MPLPVDSCQTNEAFTWKARFETKYPIVPKPEFLAKQMTKMGFDDKEFTTSEDIEICIQK
jgi:hypothetical protein